MCLYIEATCNFTNSLFPGRVRSYRFNRTRLPRKKLLKASKLMSCMDFRMILAVVKDLDNQLSRELMRIGTTCFALYFDGVVNKCT